MFKLNALQMSQPWGCSSALWEVPGCVRLLLEHRRQSLCLPPLCLSPPLQRPAGKIQRKQIPGDLHSQGLGGGKGVQPLPEMPARSSVAVQRFSPGRFWRATVTSRRFQAADAWSRPAAAVGSHWSSWLQQMHLGFPLTVPPKVPPPKKNKKNKQTPNC